MRAENNLTILTCTYLLVVRLNTFPFSCPGNCLSVFFTNFSTPLLLLLLIYRSSVYGKARFLHLGTIHIWGWILLCWGDCPEPCRIFSSISGPYPVNASSTSFNCENQKCLQGLPHVLWRAKLPLARTTVLSGLTLYSNYMLLPLGY